jgi:hypothetical protein
MILLRKKYYVPIYSYIQLTMTYHYLHNRSENVIMDKIINSKLIMEPDCRRA